MERGSLAELLSDHRGGVVGRGRVVEETDPVRFMASFSAAVASGGNVFLANPSWQAKERAELDRLLGMSGGDEKGWLMIPSGGSGGALRFARHDGGTIAAAVGGFCGHFGMARVNSVCVLPLHHVSGFMAWMRSALTGGEFLPWPWKEAEAGRFPAGLSGECCLSLVPTQLQRLVTLEKGVAWLRTFRVIFLGGGPAWDELIAEAARLRLPLSTGYGATETAAMVAALRPEQFLDGARGCGSPLPHARIEIVGGIVQVAGDSVFRGYYPEITGDRTWVSGDLGAFQAGSLQILGRSDDIIVTGGKKVSPSEVESALRDSGEFEDVAVIGVSDPEWGQAVVACHPKGDRPPATGRIKAALSHLESYKHPKRYLAVSPWPRNQQGKIDRAKLKRVAGDT